ncbi:Putative thiosulfate sulfurtransferase SseB [Corynebacterium provencense]|jgi:thiosulfate/3-mercaptopyruvate sulfurtransferase|uniref:Thiosulfate sulfurtransferase SseB n=2 Tax=Corynebacterium provencense TaxID=1737425 RepID=A0A2Z3YQD0_9CORY|nr:rhodanese-like domain-containing protein [Corynebacterium provencense]AWT27112.1 Putative thiosulfate sulfurtransferase SseB [Corynebacterium provencense]MCI1255282.1 sulfurtransferase [Corynebacterium provencense]
MAGMSPFLPADELLAAATRGERMTIIDSHWEPRRNASWDAYVSRHIPGAFWCEPLRMLAGTPSPETGRNPLPNPAQLQHYIADWGVSPELPVRVYDSGRMLWAARAWWILRWAGVTDVKILEGGTPAWESAGGDVAVGIGCLRGRGTFTVTSGSMPTIDVDEIGEWVAAGNLLVDVRGAGRYIGRREPHDRRAGHIPGAVNIPVELMLETGGVPAPEVVRERLTRRGIGGDDGVPPEKVAVYSGSGVDSALFIAAMEHAGLPGARHFVGGWSQWAGDSSRPVALGD